MDSASPLFCHLLLMSAVVEVVRECEKQVGGTVEAETLFMLAALSCLELSELEREKVGMRSYAFTGLGVKNLDLSNFKFLFPL